MEHRFTIPQISAFLISHGLSLINFEAELQAIELFQRQFPHAAITDLEQWQAFELANPLAMRYMYVFSVRKDAVNADIHVTVRTTGGLAINDSTAPNCLSTECSGKRIGRALGHNRLISEQSEPLPFDFAGQRTLIGVEEHVVRHFELAQEVKNF